MIFVKYFKYINSNSFFYMTIFLCIICFKLKFIFSKLKIKVIKIFALEKKYNIDRKISLKLDKIE